VLKPLTHEETNKFTKYKATLRYCELQMRWHLKPLFFFQYWFSTSNCINLKLFEAQQIACAFTFPIIPLELTTRPPVITCSCARCNTCMKPNLILLSEQSTHAYFYHKHTVHIYYKQITEHRKQ